MPAPKLKPGQKDGRTNNGRPLSTGELKKSRTLWLTDTAVEKLKSLGGGKWLETYLRSLL